MKRYYHIFCLVLSCLVLNSQILKAEKSFEQYKTKIINLSKAENFERAKALLKKSQEVFSERLEYHAALCYYLASGYYENGRLNEGKMFLEKVLQEYSSYNWLFTLYSKFLIKTGESDKALAILKRYPDDANSFPEDLKRSPVDSLTGYNIAASYALLKKNDLAILYLSAFWLSQETDLEKRFETAHNDPDFKTLHNDQRYVLFQNMIRAQDFDEVVEIFIKELKFAHESIKQFFNNEKSAQETVKRLRKIRGNIYSTRTVAPILTEIQNQEIDYIDALMEVVSEQKEKSFTDFEKTYNSILNSIEYAIASQTTHRQKPAESAESEA